MIATNDDALAHKMRMMKNFGFTNYDQVDYLGTNGKMNEISAAMGLTNLESMDAFVAINRRNYEQYREGLTDVDGVTLIAYPEKERCNYQYVVVEVDEPRLGISRDALVEQLHAQGIIARRYFYPGCHRMEPYRSYFPNAGILLPQTERLSARLICLPNGESVTPEDIARVCQAIRGAVK